MNLFQLPACWYCIVAVGFSVYQAVRGFMFQNQFAIKEGQKGLCADKRWERWLIRAFNDACRYFVCTLAGFVSLLLAYRILNSLNSISALSGGAATLLVFLVLFGILGVTGLLPDFLPKVDKFST